MARRKFLIWVLAGWQLVKALEEVVPTSIEAAPIQGQDIIRMNYTGDLPHDMIDWATRKQMMTNCTPEHITIAKQADMFAARYVFPVQFVCGFIGNVLNLCVLLTMNTEMSVANILFAGVALADLGLLVSMSTCVIGAWPYFYTKNHFRWFYYKTHFIALMLSNVFLCISSWFVSAVSIERFLSVRDPIRLHRETNSCRVYAIMIAIVIGSIVLNIYHLLEHRYGFVYICDGEILFGLFHSVEMLQKSMDISPFLIFYVHYSKIIQIMLAVFIPLTLITVLNLRIIYMLKGSRQIIATPRVTTERERVMSPNSRSTSTEEARQRRDRKISITIVTIISFYIITHAPSTIPFLIETLKLGWPVWMKSYGNTVLIYWVLCGKVMNFVLFCLTSKYFRARLVVFFQTRITRLLSRIGFSGLEKKYSVISNGRNHSMKMNILKRYHSNTASDYTEVEVHPRMSKDE